jgi:hypothetical protein
VAERLAPAHRDGSLPVGSDLPDLVARRLDWEITAEFGFSGAFGATLENVGLAAARDAAQRRAHAAGSGALPRGGSFGGVTAIAVSHKMGRRRLVESHRLDQAIDRHALPLRPKLAPLGDAMDVDGDLSLRQGLKLLPRPPARERSPILQRQGPLLECRMRRRAGAQHREVVGDELAGRNPISFGLGRLLAREASGRRHERGLLPRIRRSRNPRLNAVAPSASFLRSV